MYAQSQRKSRHLDPVAQPRFTRAQRRTLHRLRVAYQRDRDLFSASELARLRFWRWLYRSGKLEP